MTFKKQAFTATLLPPQPTPGEVVFRHSGTAPSKTISWVVPADVYEISAVLVNTGQSGGGQYLTKLKRGATELLTGSTTIAGSVGGGNGGTVATWGGAGAGGYSGDGGNGATTSSTNGSAGAGGGGGGGAYGGTPSSQLGWGGGVGLKGQGANGAGGLTGGTGTTARNGGTGSPPASGISAGGGWGANVPGGNLRWKNAIAVTPGETLTVTFDDPAGAAWPDGQGPAARIMWGGGRSYPSNAGDAIPTGQQTLTASNTTFTVPAGVTSVSACAQQLTGASDAVTLVVAGSTVLRAENGNRLGDGGGDGGAIVGNEGGGGGGGYSGNGGDSSSNGSGGGGAGGPAGYLVENPSGAVFGGSNPAPTYTYVPPGNGGGVGIAGEGASGTVSGDLRGSPDPVDGYMGGGIGAGGATGEGGALAYKNAITVTPGQVLTVNAAGGRIRIIWGPGRSYPSNAGRA